MTMLQRRVPINKWGTRTRARSHTQRRIENSLIECVRAGGWLRMRMQACMPLFLAERGSTCESARLCVHRRSAGDGCVKSTSLSVAVFFLSAVCCWLVRCCVTEMPLSMWVFNYALCWEFKVSGGYFNLWWNFCVFKDFLLGYRRWTFKDLADVVGIPYFVPTCVRSSIIVIPWFSSAPKTIENAEMKANINVRGEARKCDSTALQHPLKPTWKRLNWEVRTDQQFCS